MNSVVNLKEASTDGEDVLYCFERLDQRKFARLHEKIKNTLNLYRASEQQKEKNGRMVTPERNMKQILSETPQISTDHRGFTSFTDISPCKAPAQYIPPPKFDLEPALEYQLVKKQEEEDLKKEISEPSGAKSDEELISNIVQAPQEEDVKVKQEPC